MVLAGILFSHSELNGSRVLFFDWLGLMMVFFVMFVIPFDIAIWLLKNIYKKLRKKVYQEKNNSHPEENSGLKIQNESLDISKTKSIHPAVLKSEINTEPQNDILIANYDKMSSRHTFYPESEFPLHPNNSSCNVWEKNNNFNLESFMRECNAYVIKEDRKIHQEKCNATQTASISESINQTLIKTPAYYSDYNFDNMEGHDFEYFCAGVLEKNKFVHVEVTKGSGDQGIDIIAYKDGIKYGIQCKCYSSDIGNKAVQEVIAGKKFYNCHVGAVLTNRYFTRSAKELAEKTGILLWDREHLEKLIHNSND